MASIMFRHISPGEGDASKKSARTGSPGAARDWRHRDQLLPLMLVLVRLPFFCCVTHVTRQQLVCTVAVAVAAMRIQVTEATFTELKSSHLGYIMKQRGQVEIKVDITAIMQCLSGAAFADSDSDRLYFAFLVYFF